MDQKKFQIHKPNVQKKFEIEPDKPKKKFIVESGTPDNWTQQRNSNDCGPALLLNSLRELSIEVPDKTIGDVRVTVNAIRGNSPLPPTGWFLSSDVGRYFSEVAKLRVEEFMPRPYERQEVAHLVESRFRDRSFDLIYITIGRHFKGILNKQNELILLDSFKSCPEVLSSEQALELIKQTLNATDGTRIEVIGVVSRGESGYVSS